MTNHAGALAAIAGNPGARLRDVADALGITVRAAHRIVCELESAGYVTRHRVGRRNFYEVHADAPLEPPAADGRTLGDLLELLLKAA